jgi:hypothetical protein
MVKKPSHATVPLKTGILQNGKYSDDDLSYTPFQISLFGHSYRGDNLYVTSLQEENTRRAFCKPKTQRARLNNVVLEQSSREREEGREYGNKADKG